MFIWRGWGVLVLFIIFMTSLAANSCCQYFGRQRILERARLAACERINYRRRTNLDDRLIFFQKTRSSVGGRENG